MNPCLGKSYRYSTSILALVVAVMLAAPATGLAQQSGDAVRDYIERTGELLAWSHDLVSETESGPARRVLSQAVQLHRRSVRLLENGKLSEALAVGRRARDAMWHSVRVAREAMGLAERIRIRVERFRDQYGNLLERAREGRNERALDFLERAHQQASRAQDLYRQGDFKLAWKMFEQANDLMGRAARLLADHGGRGRLEQELERTRELIEQTRDRLGSNATAAQRQLLAEAEESWQRAQQAFDEGQTGRALQMVNMSRSLARRALGQSGGSPSADSIQRQLDRFADRAERIGEIVRASESEPARKMFGRALELRDRAASAHQAGDHDLALRQIKSAHDLLNQAEKMTR